MFQRTLIVMVCVGMAVPPGMSGSKAQEIRVSTSAAAPIDRPAKAEIFARRHVRHHARGDSTAADLGDNTTADLNEEELARIMAGVMLEQEDTAPPYRDDSFNGVIEPICPAAPIEATPEYPEKILKGLEP